MDKGQVIDTLRRHRSELNKQGVTHAGLFGSLARGDSGPDSDIDILIDLDPLAGLSVFDYAEIKSYVAGLFEGQVDVVSRAGLKPYVKPAVLADVIYAF